MDVAEPRPPLPSEPLRRLPGRCMGKVHTLLAFSGKQAAGGDSPEGTEPTHGPHPSTGHCHQHFLHVEASLHWLFCCLRQRILNDILPEAPVPGFLDTGPVFHQKTQKPAWGCGAAGSTEAMALPTPPQQGWTMRCLRRGVREPFQTHSLHRRGEGDP